jgi:hypothetical protein
VVHEVDGEDDERQRDGSAQHGPDACEPSAGAELLGHPSCGIGAADDERTSDDDEGRKAERQRDGDDTAFSGMVVTPRCQRRG